MPYWKLLYLESWQVLGRMLQFSHNTLPFREDRNAWFGETKDRKIGFFKKEHVEEVHDENIDGRQNIWVYYVYSLDNLQSLS